MKKDVFLIAFSVLAIAIIEIIIAITGIIPAFFQIKYDTGAEMVLA